MQAEAPNQVTDKICWDFGHKSPFDCCLFKRHRDWALERWGSKTHWEFSWLILRHWPKSQSFPSWRSWNRFHWDEHEPWSWSRVCWLFWNVFLHFFLGTDVRSALNQASFWYQDLRWQSGEEEVLKIWIKGTFGRINERLFIEVDVFSFVQTFLQLIEICLILWKRPWVTHGYINFLGVVNIDGHSEVGIILWADFKLHWWVVPFPLSAFDFNHRPV